MRARLLPGAPAWLVVAAAAAALVAAVSALAPVPGLGPVQPVAAVALQGCLVTVLLWRARQPSPERRGWARMASAMIIFSVCMGLNRALDGVTAHPALAWLPLGLAPVLGFPRFYGALVRWNRYSTSLADPDDTINGLSAALAVLAVLDVVVHHHPGAMAGAPWWRVQPLLAQVACSFVILGTAVGTAFLGGLVRDPRVWLVVAAFAGYLTDDVVAVVSGGRSLEGLGAPAATAGVCLCLAVVLRPVPAPARPADPADSTAGAFAVVLAALLALAVDGLGGVDTASVACAALAGTGAGVRLLYNVRELTALAVSRQEALTDDLTGLANRRALLRGLEQRLAGGAPFLLAFLDLNKFKDVNDSLGHAAGDDLLRQVAGRLATAAGPDDVLARLGGDEFAFLSSLEGEDAGRARAVVEQLLAPLAAAFTVGGLSVHTGASTGVTVAPPGGVGSSSQLLREADTAMYDAKRRALAVVVHDPARHTDSSGDLTLVEELRTALATSQLQLHFQPQVEVATGRTTGVEALVRWAHPARGLLAPDQFVPLAEVHGLMGALTDEVLGLAIAQTAAWRARGLRLRTSVNLSASNLLDADLPRRVGDLLHAHGVPGTSLVLEVTESVLISDPERSLAVLTALTDLGATVSVDDFGTGYASLTHLRQLPVGELKLDRSFTADLLTDPRATAIVVHTTALAHALGLRVVAEGVEDDATLARLVDHGCDHTQGYLHSRPLPADRLLDWLGERRDPGAPLAEPGIPERAGPHSG